MSNTKRMGSGENTKGGAEPTDQPSNQAAEQRLETLRVRIKERLRETGLSARAASLQAGLGSDAIRIILDGRSRNTSFERIAALAEVLKCDYRYLLGYIEEPLTVNRRLSGIVQTRPMPITGRIEPGAWREGDAELDFQGSFEGRVYLEFDERRQWFEVMMGDSFNIRVAPGSYVQFVDVRDIPNYRLVHGDVVLVTRRRGDLEERSLREVSGLYRSETTLRLLSTNLRWEGADISAESTSLLTWGVDRDLHYLYSAEEKQALKDDIARYRKLQGKDPQPQFTEEQPEQADSVVTVVGLALEAYSRLSRN